MPFVVVSHRLKLLPGCHPARQWLKVGALLSEICLARELERLPTSGSVSTLTECGGSSSRYEPKEDATRKELEMKRSEINQITHDAIAFVTSMNFKLPPFAYWSLEDWKTKGSEYDEIKDNMLGWDITDFGSGDFAEVGLLIFTLRNGNFSDRKYDKPYCEKILIVAEQQVLPYHFHWNKMEDIVNRGGGNLLIEVRNADANEEFADTPVSITMDGRRLDVSPGQILRLAPGESITLRPRQYHKFWGQKGTGKVLLGEVSTVNDDRVDNRFHDYSGRFPEIVEDEQPRYLLFQDYTLLRT